MDKKELIPANLFCTQHDVELSLISMIKEAGLVEIAIIDEQLYVPADELPALEKCIHLYEMDINVEGIETICHLLNRIASMQQNIVSLRNRLALYE